VLRKSQMGEEVKLSAISFLCLIVCFLVFLTSPTEAQDQINADPTTPAELTPGDLEIRSILGLDDKSCKLPNADASAKKIQKALQMADSRGLVGDRAVLQAMLASLLIAQGEAERAFLFFQKALQDSLDAKRQTLQADILISLASEPQMKGNAQKGVELVNEALSLSEKSGNLYGKARALGELGRLKLQIGKNDEAVTLIDQALNIDRLNGYKFEARHLFYKGTYLGVIGQDDEAIQLLAEARAKAILTRDVMTFIQSENTYAFGLVKKGKVDEAIRQMDLLQDKNLEEFIRDATTRDCLASYLEVPIVHLIWLEGFANVLEAANQKEREIGVWQDVFSTSHGLDFLAGEAEAKEKIANLEAQLKKTNEAIKDYAVAADLYRKLGNEALLDQVEIAESVLLVNSGRGNDAVPLVEEIASYAKRFGLRQLQFRAYITLAEICQPTGDTAKVRDALEKARSLVHPGPFDEELDNKTVHLAYVSLSDIYRKLGISTKELLSIDQAFFVSFYLKDEEAQQREVSYLDQRLNDLHIRELAERQQTKGQLTESLIYSYVLVLRDGFPSNPAENPNWQRILNLPFQITQRPEGAADLVGILNDLGPLLGLEKLPLLNALAKYYIASGSDPSLAEKYALESENIVNGLNGDQTALKVDMTCVLAVSYARQSKNALAKARSEECLNFADKTHEEQTLIYANAMNAMAQAQIGNIAAAKSSLEKLISKSPNNPELLTELAMSLAGARLYKEANSQLGAGVRKSLSAGDKRTAASAYTRMSIALDSDSSDTAKKLQLEYLRAAFNLYQELGAESEEAGILIALGDYFLKVAQSATAIDEYRRAQELAQRAGQKNITAQSLLGLGNAYEAQKHFARASDFHERAGEFFRELSNSVGETISLRVLGRDYYELNDTRKALAALLEARRVANKAGPIHAYFAAYFLGDFYRSQGEYEKAFASFREAAEVTTKNGDTEHSAYSHLALAQVDSFVGAWEDSVSEAEIALNLFQKVGNKGGQGLCWGHLTTVYSDRTSSLKDFDKAQECYRKALEFDHGKTLELDLLEIYLQTGKYEEAAKIAKEGIRDCLKGKDTTCRAHALISLSEAERLSGNFKMSRTSLHEARPLVAKSSDLYLKGRLQYQGSRLLASEGKLSEALSSYKLLIAMIEGIKGKLSTEEQKSLAENYSFIYDELVSLLYSMSEKSPTGRFGFASTALEYAEKNKARQFAESWGRVFRNQMAGALPPSVREREQFLYSQRDHITTKLKDASDSGDTVQNSNVGSLNSDLSNVQDQINLFLKDLRRVSPQYAAITYPEDIQISNIPLHRGETLVEFKVTENSTFVWIVQNRDGAENQLKAFYEVPRKRAWIAERVSAVRKQLNSADPEAVDLKICEELFAALFPNETAKILQESEELVLIPDDALFVLPFELYSPAASKGEFRLLKKATTYYPSAVSLRLARTARLQSNWQESFLGVADPITSSEDQRFGLLNLPTTLEKNGAAEDTSLRNVALSLAPNSASLQSRGFSFERLPGTAREVQGIASLLKSRKEPVDLRIGIDATKSKLLDTDLSKFRFLHFATHGVLAVDAGIQEPSLVLSSDGIDSSHMFLSMSEIIGLKLQSESVVLSACNTGSGKISRAEGVMSLGRAFLAAGAASVTVSLWQVSDDSTALLMERYYEGILANKKKSVALAEARYAVFTSGSKSPFFWAPFIVIGE
jgi:CHAT domain-containing protein